MREKDCMYYCISKEKRKTKTKEKKRRERQKKDQEGGERGDERKSGYTPRYYKGERAQRKEEREIKPWGNKLHVKIESRGSRNRTRRTSPLARIWKRKEKNSW